MEISELHMICEIVNLRLNGVTFSLGRNSQLQQQT